VSAKGPVGTDVLKYHAMISNGSSNRQEIDKGKSFMLSLGLYPSKNWIFEAYGEFSDYEGPYNGFIYQGFAAFTTEKLRAGLLYSDQTIEENAAPDLKRRVLSIFVIAEIFEKISVLGRVDRMFDANPEGSKVAYTPFNESAPFYFFIFGVDWVVFENLSIIPNIEYTLYDDVADILQPKNDFYGKLTFYWQFK
jgi:hypothetical protein